MTAKIINFPVASPGNGAREALIETALTLPNDTGENDAAAWADWILGELWMRGFKIVPMEILQ